MRGVFVAAWMSLAMLASPAMASDKVIERNSEDGRFRTIMVDAKIGTNHYWIGKTADVVAYDTPFEEPFREAMKKKHGELSTKARYIILKEHLGDFLSYNPPPKSKGEAFEPISFLGALGASLLIGNATGGVNGIGGAWHVAANADSIYSRGANEKQADIGSKISETNLKGAKLAVYRICRGNPCSVIMTSSADPSVTLADLEKEAFKGILEMAGLN